MSDYQGTIWGPSIKSIRDQNRFRLETVTKSLAGLKNRDSQYSRDHRMLVDLYAELCEVIDRHIEKAGTILPAPTSAKGGR